MTGDPPLPPDLLGSVIDGKYRVERVLGRGGMALVVAAQPLDGRAPLALKLLMPEALVIPDAKTRFFREANTLAMLENEHVVRVYDVGRQEDSGLPYMTMELLEGKNLAELLEERGPLPIQDACAYAVQACEALVEAHRQGIVHRDIKPANLFLAEGAGGSSIKVIDFGIAKELDSSERQTSTRMVMGSVAHMPPEQLKAAKYAEPRSDIWAIGSTLFELLTGQRPFQAPSLPQLIVTIHCDPPRSVAALRPEIPPGLVRVLLRCLEKKPEQRYPSVADLAAALRPFVTGEAPPPEPPATTPSTAPPTAILSTEPPAAPPPVGPPAPATAKVVPAASVSEKRSAASSAPAAMSVQELVVPAVVFGVLVVVGLLALALLRNS